MNTHAMTDKTYVKDFVPAGAPHGTQPTRAATMAAGVQLYDMYDWLNDNDIMVVGGSSHGVGVTGGYVQGGGHSLLAAYQGMASDNALEFTIVTADVSGQLSF